MSSSVFVGRCEYAVKLYFIAITDVLKTFLWHEKVLSRIYIVALLIDNLRVIQSGVSYQKEISYEDAYKGGYNKNKTINECVN